MKHWQYTDIPSVCQQCGYKTCSLPTFKRHVKHCSVSTSTLGPEGSVTESHEGPAGVAPLESSSCDFSAVGENHVSHVKLCHPNKVKTEKMNEECGFTGSVVLDDGKPAAGQSIPAEDEPLENDITTSEAKTNDEKALVASDVAETSGSLSKTKPEASGKKPSRKSLVADAKCESRKASPRTNRRSADKMASPDESRKPSQMSHEPKVLVVEGHALFCCMLCDFLSSDEKTTRSHIKCCSERAKKYYCSKCDFSCDDKLVLVKHRLQHNVNESGQKTIYSCLECLYKTPLKKNFERHRACHSSAAAVKCNFCSYSSTGESAVRRHISTYHCFPDGPVDENSKTLDLENEEALPAVEAHSSSPTKTPQKSTKEKPISASSTLKSGSRDQKHSKQSSPSETKTPRSVSISHVQKDIRKKPKPPRTPKSDKIEKLVKTPDAASDDPSPSGVEDKELEENFEVDGVTDIVWSCYYCKLDFKRRCDMEDHTQAEHSINLKDCVMYSLEKGASDVSLYELEQDSAADVPPSIPDADVNGLTQLHCDLCGFKGRRLSDLKRHFRLKHCARENGVTVGKKSSKRPQENSTLVQNKKLKSVDSSSSSEGSTILAKLLQNDDPNYVYKPSTSCGDCADRVKKTEAKFTLESPDRKKSIARAVDSSEEIPIQIKVPDEGRVAEAPKFSGENCVQNPNSSSPGEEEPDMEVSYLTRLMCNYCGYLGNNPAEVERHTKIHTGEKNYWCTCCDYKTIWKCDIKKHLEKFHPKEMDTPERLRSLLHSAFRPDGKHTAEELGYRKRPRKDKGENSSDGGASPGLKKSHSVSLKCKKDVAGTLNSSEKLLNKAKKNLLLQKVLQPKSTDGDEGHELNSVETTAETPVVMDVENTSSSAPPEIVTPVMKPPCQKLPRKQTDRCRPFKCSACGKRSNWKWDLKKHINEQHPEATIITLNKEEAQKTFAEMLRLHQEKLRLAGHAPGSRRIRIVTAQDQGKPEDQASETTPALADNVEAAGGKMLSPRKPLLTGRSILKGMVDLQKLKRFKCSGCIYRSNFRGDISRHIRSRHSSIRCSVIVMPADLATASLRSYESRWSMRKIDPSVVVESSAGVPAGSLHMDAVQNLGGEASANHEDFGEDGNDNKWRLGQKLKQLDSASLIGKRAVGGGNGRKNGTDAEEGETVKRREKTSQVEEDDLKYCTVCPYVTEKSDVLKLHMSYHQPQARNGYSCTFCPYFVNTERLLHHHLQLHMSKETLAAQRPEITHTTKNSTSYDSKYICEFCPYVSKLRSNYWAHRKNHFEKPNALFKCGSCQYWTKDQRHLSQHTKLHEKSYFPKMLLPPSNNEQKQDSNNGCCRCVFAENNGDERFRCGETLKCPYCSYAIPSLRLLRQHMIFHVSFTDAVKNLFFHKKFDGADDYLFVHCKNRPLEDDEREMPSKENVFPSGPRHLFPFGSASNELLGDSSVESGFLPSNAFSRGPDDAISVHSIDTDLPELDRFSSGNSDILDRRVSPVFLEAVLMENIQEFSDIPLDETVSVVELPESSGTTPLNEAVAVVELSLREFLCGGKKFSVPDARHSNEPGNEVVWLQEEVEPMEVQVVTAEESEDVASEGAPFDEALDSTVVSECQLVFEQKGSSKSDENISGEKTEVVAEPGISSDVADGSLVTRTNAFPSPETVETVTGLLSKDSDGFDGMSSYEGIRVEDNTDKMLKSANELGSSGDGKCLSGKEISLDISKLEELQMVEKNNVTPSESDNTAADSATRESPSTPENKTSNDVPVNGCGALEHAPTSRSVYYTAKGISLESSRPSATETDMQVGNTFDCEVSPTDVHSIFHKDGFKEGCENTSSDDDAAVKRCDYEVDYFRSIGLVKVKFM